MLSLFFLALFAINVQRCFAGIFITYPVATTSIASGTTFNITWQADVIQSLPLATSFGPSYIGLYTGSSQVQFSLVAFGNVTDPIKTNSFQVSIPATAGPSSNDYFIRFQSSNSTLTAPIQSFSARFTLTNMTGTFTAAQISENAANSTLTPVTSSSSTAAPTSTTSSTSSMITSTSATTNSSSSASSTSTAKSTNLAQVNKVNVAGLMGVLSFFALAL